MVSLYYSVVQLLDNPPPSSYVTGKILLEMCVSHIYCILWSVVTNNLFDRFPTSVGFTCLANLPEGE
jgi:hypothetical protein